jgi:spermidine synthase
MSLWYTEDFDNRVRFGLRVEKTLFRQQSKYQLVEVFDTVEFGRTLTIDGVFMTSVGDEFFYHEMLAHPALTTVAEPKSVLIIGGGDGGTAREALRHPEIESLVQVEIDEVVVNACKEHFPKEFAAWDDPRMELIIGDGIQYVKDAPENSIDIVLLDGTDPVGPAEGLFNEDFYAHVHRIVKPNGVFALQSESPVIFHDTFVQIQRTLVRQFKSVRPYFDNVPLYCGGGWSWTFATDEVDHMSPIEERVNRLEKVTKHYNGDIHRGAFAVPNRLRKELGIR